MKAEAEKERERDKDRARETNRAKEAWAVKDSWITFVIWPISSLSFMQIVDGKSETAQIKENRW